MTNPIERTMVKNVKIHAPIAIKTVTPTIYGDIDKMSMTPANIMKCLIGRATVWEILSDGSLLKLNNTNYNTVNTPASKIAPATQTLAKDIDRSAIVPEEEATNFKTMILKDNIGVHDKVDIDPSTVESLNEKIAEAGEIPAPTPAVEMSEEEVSDTDWKELTSQATIESKEDEDPHAKEEHELTPEEKEAKELEELQAEIDKLDADEKKNS